MASTLYNIQSQLASQLTPLNSSNSNQSNDDNDNDNDDNEEESEEREVKTEEKINTIMKECETLSHRLKQLLHEHLKPFLESEINTNEKSENIIVKESKNSNLENIDEEETQDTQADDFIEDGIDNNKVEVPVEDKKELTGDGNNNSDDTFPPPPDTQSKSPLKPTLSGSSWFSQITISGDEKTINNNNNNESKDKENESEDKGGDEDDSYIIKEQPPSLLLPLKEHQLIVCNL